MTQLPPHRIWTREQVLALPDDGYRYELIDGQLLTSPAHRADHQRALMALIRLIDPYVQKHALGELLPGPVDLDLFADQKLQPDLVLIPYRNGDRFADWPDAGIPWLVVEIQTAYTARADHGSKREQYQKAEVPTYWVFDHEEPRVSAWTPDAPEPIIETKRITWQPVESIPPLEIDLVEFYDSVFNVP